MNRQPTARDPQQPPAAQLSPSFQPRIPTSRVLARHDGEAVGTSTNFVVYTVPARTTATVRFFSFTNRGSSGAPTYVSFFATRSESLSPRIYRYLFAEEDQVFILSGGEEMVLNAGDKLEVLATTNTVTADIYVSGIEEVLPS